MHTTHEQTSEAITETPMTTEDRLTRIVRFAGRHPILSLAAAAGAVVVGGEVVTAVLLGGGIGMLLAPRSGGELRRDVFHRARAAVHALRNGKEQGKSDTPTTTP